MPSSMTHAYFSLDVFDKLNKNSQKKVRKNIEDLKTFSEGPDIFFFYNTMVGKKAKEMRKFAMQVQNNKTADFFINLITYIKDNKLQSNAQVMSFLYGFICHYVLDSTIHPYIHYKAGIFDKKKKETMKYNGMHYEIEYYLDIYMIFQKEKIEPKDFKMYKFLGNTTKFNPKLKKTINYVFEKTFNKPNMSNAYYKGLKGMKLFFHIYNYDNFGIKKKLYKIIDFISPTNYRRKEVLSFNVPHNMKIHYLNLEKNEWNHPFDRNEIYNYSFIELYRISIEKATKLIDEVTNILDGISNTPLETLFDNISYSTGKNCEDKRILQYFEF